MTKDELILESERILARYGGQLLGVNRKCPFGGDTTSRYDAFNKIRKSSAKEILKLVASHQIDQF